MEWLFVKLYPLVALLSFSGYVPQIIKLIRAKTRNDGMALQAWFTWILTSVISLGYGVFHLKDGLFIATVGTTFVCIVTVACLLVWNRYFRFKTRELCIKTLRAHGL